MNIDLDKHIFCANFHQLVKYYNDTDVRYIFLYGGSSSSKTYSVVQFILLSTLCDGKNSLIFRKVFASIRKTIYNDFKMVIDSLQLSDYFTIQDLKIKCSNGAVIDFLGLDDAEKVKGISSYQRIVVDEVTELEPDDFAQLKKRMRGIFNQKLIMTFNPISSSHWLKSKLIDNIEWIDKPNGDNIFKVTDVKQSVSKQYVLIHSTYLNNQFIVGMKDEGKSYGWVDKQTIASFNEDKLVDENYYRIYALGEWGVAKTGLEFYHNFSLSRNTSILKTQEGNIWLSIDENVIPYISLVWGQINDNFNILGCLTAEQPNNNIEGVVKLFSERCPEYKNRHVILTGDATSKKSDVRAKGNLFTLVRDELNRVGYTDVEIRVINSNPSQVDSGNFINRLFLGYEGTSIQIDTSARRLLDDLAQTKTNDNGGILKEKGSLFIDGHKYCFEKHGHLSDAMRYLIHNSELGKQLFSKFIHKESIFDGMDIDLTDDYSM